MRDPYAIIMNPRMTEKSLALSYGPRGAKEEEISRKYTFLVAVEANKIEIKKALEAIYNAGKKKNDQLIKVMKVNTIKMDGKMRYNFKKPGKKAAYKKAIVTLAEGQILEDFGV